MNKYENRVKEILNSKMIEWEETSISYNNLLSFMILQQWQRKKNVDVSSGRGIEQSFGGVKILFLHSNLDVLELSMYCKYLKRWTESFEVIDVFEITEMEVKKLQKLVASGNYFVFKAYEQNIEFLGAEGKKFFCKKRKSDYLISLIEVWTNAIPLVLPFIRKRGEEICCYVASRQKAFGELALRLEDDISRDTLFEILRCAVTNDVYRLEEGSQYFKYWECYRHYKDEVFVNCGSAGGDTILKYIYQDYSFEKIYAYEGDTSLYLEMKKVLSNLPTNIQKNIEIISEYIGLGATENNFDHRFEKEKVTLINMDIEGAEMEVLKGAKKVIEQQRPVMAVCAYHKATDLLDIPMFIDTVTDNYLIYLRKYKGYEPNALNEYLFYLVPKERAL